MSKANWDRRDFLKLGGAGIAASALSAGCATVATQPKVQAPVVKATEIAKATPPVLAVPTRRSLGRTGIEVPVVSMGVMNADNPNLVRAALDGGMFLLDTAHVVKGFDVQERIRGIIRLRNVPREFII